MKMCRHLIGSCNSLGMTKSKDKLRHTITANRLRKMRKPWMQMTGK